MSSSNKSKEKYTNLLMYAAATLSVVSFLTTFNGMKGIVTTNTAIAILISFGIQSIILFVGVYFIPAILNMLKSNIKRFLVVIAIILLIISYISAVIFSSSFSYVYLANNAYNIVRPTDYDKQLEYFLVNNTKEIKNINEAESKIIVKRIREIAPKFKSLINDYNEDAIAEFQRIKNELSKYNVSEISDNRRFVAQEAINAFNGSRTITADSYLEEDCRRIESDINQYIEEYKSYYQEYEACYSDIISLSDINHTEIENNKREVSRCKTRIQNRISKFENVQWSSFSDIQQYARQKCDDIAEDYDKLFAELCRIEDKYEEFESNPIIAKRSNVDLDHFYQAIYSTDILSADTFNEATEDLKKIISNYIVDNSDTDEILIRDLTECVEFLNTLERCKNTEGLIQNFEDNNLSISYIIEPGDSEDDNVHKGGNDNSNNVKNVSIDTWEYIRRKDVSEFISIIKTIPEANYIIMSSDDDDNVIYLKEKDADKFISDMLELAYDYKRNKLTKITDMEKAWKYFSSDENGPAIFCLLIAAFLDLASFIIGFVLFVSGKRVD